MDFNMNSGFITPQEAYLLKKSVKQNDKDITELEQEVAEIAEDVEDVKENIEDITSAVNELAESKQDKLTAGQNITIENNVISATGGKAPADIEYISETNVGGLNEFTINNLSDLDYISIAMYIPENTGATANWSVQLHISYDNDSYIFTGTQQNVVYKDKIRDNIYHFINMGAAGWNVPFTNHDAFKSPTHDYGNFAGGTNIIIQHPGKIKSIRCNLYQSAANLFPTGTTVTVCGK